MAMTREAVASVQTLANELAQYASNGSSVGLSSLGSAAGSFQDFLAKTEGGQDFFEKYVQLTKILEDFYEQVNQMGAVVNDLVAKQESINS